MRGNRKWAAAVVVALAETAAGAGPGGVGTGRGPPGRGERRSCPCGRDRCRATSDEAWGGRGAPGSLAGQWPGRDSNGPGASSLQPQGMPRGELEFQSVVF